MSAVTSNRCLSAQLTFDRSSVLGSVQVRQSPDAAVPNAESFRTPGAAPPGSCVSSPWELRNPEMDRVTTAATTAPTATAARPQRILCAGRCERPAAWERLPARERPAARGGAGAGPGSSQPGSDSVHSDADSSQPGSDPGSGARCA